MQVFQRRAIRGGAAGRGVNQGNRREGGVGSGIGWCAAGRVNTGSFSSRDGLDGPVFSLRPTRGGAATALVATIGHWCVFAVEERRNPAT